MFRATLPAAKSCIFGWYRRLSDQVRRAWFQATDHNRHSNGATRGVLRRHASTSAPGSGGSGLSGDVHENIHELDTEPPQHPPEYRQPPRIAVNLSSGCRPSLRSGCHGAPGPGRKREVTNPRVTRRGPLAGIGRPPALQCGGPLGSRVDRRRQVRTNRRHSGTGARSTSYADRSASGLRWWPVRRHPEPTAQSWASRRYVERCTARSWPCNSGA